MGRHISKINKNAGRKYIFRGNVSNVLLYRILNSLDHEMSKLLQKNPEGKLHGQEIVDSINVTISKYYDTATMEPQVIEDLSPFKKITRKLQMKKGLISKSEAIAIYMEEVKKDLMKNLDIDIKDDISMVSASHTNEEEDACIAGEEQDVDEEEIDLETILKRYQQQLKESSSARIIGKGKEYNIPPTTTKNWSHVIRGQKKLKLLL
ncbi:hypothetical protein H5410_003363 [Solanum commersonii]|uniref:Uncharacterized protein n=1 Tax=Solanum commersonii TaxID=4109 RepID=A0A9J6B4G9_SOLCO|nr:hypothetical protein H5410_003363 [Solanum commersonii]